MIVDELINTNVFTINSDATVKEAAARMAQHEVGSLIVMEGNKPVGIVTERDLISKVLALSKGADVTKIKIVMSKPLICGDPNMDLTEAARFMLDREIKKLPIVKNGLLMGILTLTDLLAARPDMYDIFEKEAKGKLPKRFMKRLAKRYYKT